MGGARGALLYRGCSGVTGYAGRPVDASCFNRLRRTTRQIEQTSTPETGVPGSLRFGAPQLHTLADRRSAASTAMRGNTACLHYPPASMMAPILIVEVPLMCPRSACPCFIKSGRAWLECCRTRPIWPMSEQFSPFVATRHYMCRTWFEFDQIGPRWGKHTATWAKRGPTLAKLGPNWVYLGACCARWANVGQMLVNIDQNL